MPLSKRILFFLIAIAIVVWGIKWYNADRIFHQKHYFDKYYWNSNDTISCNFELEEDDFKDGIDLNLELRYIYGCSYSKIPIKLEITKPDKKNVLKDIVIKIRDEKGDYLGEGMGDYWDVKIKVNADSLFNKTGNYELRLWSAQGSLLFVDDIIISLHKR